MESEEQLDNDRFIQADLDADEPPAKRQKLTSAIVSRMNIKMLKKELNTIGYVTSGNKADLANRLLSSFSGDSDGDTLDMPGEVEEVAAIAAGSACDAGDIDEKADGASNSAPGAHVDQKADSAGDGAKDADHVDEKATSAGDSTHDADDVDQKANSAGDSAAGAHVDEKPGSLGDSAKDADHVHEKATSAGDSAYDAADVDQKANSAGDSAASAHVVEKADCAGDGAKDAKRVDEKAESAPDIATEVAHAPEVAPPTIAAADKDDDDRDSGMAILSEDWWGKSNGLSTDERTAVSARSACPGALDALSDDEVEEIPSTQDALETLGPPTEDKKQTMADSRSVPLFSFSSAKVPNF
jgi:hypothetical protein